MALDDDFWLKGIRRGDVVDASKKVVVSLE
jgi:hypothetical protein